MGERIERFDSKEEERRFWNKTPLESIAPGELEEAKVDRPSRPLSTTFAIRLDQKSVEDLREVARLLGVRPTQLARSWILDRLRLERQVGVLAEHSTDLGDLETSVRIRIVDTLMAAAPKIAERALDLVIEDKDQALHDFAGGS